MEKNAGHYAHVPSTESTNKLIINQRNNFIIYYFDFEIITMKMSCHEIRLLELWLIRVNTGFCSTGCYTFNCELGLRRFDTSFRFNSKLL